MTQYAIWFLGCGMCFINVRNYFPHYIYNPKCHIQNQISLQICRRLHGKQKYFLVKIVGSALSCNLFIGHIVTVTDHTFSIIKFTIMGWFKAIFKNNLWRKISFLRCFCNFSLDKRVIKWQWHWFNVSEKHNRRLYLRQLWVHE